MTAIAVAAVAAAPAESWIPPVRIARCDQCDTEWNEQVEPTCFLCGEPGKPGRIRNGDMSFLWMGAVVPVHWDEADLDEGLESV